MSTMHSLFSGRGWGLRLLLVVTLAGAGCDFLDPTEVDNPQTTDDDLANANDPTHSLLPGLRAQFARMTSAQSVVGEVASDNYSIHGTGLDGDWDYPRLIRPSTVNATNTSTGTYWNSQELKALATFVIEEIAPNDEGALPEDVAEAYYYRGMAYLNLAENFSYAPAEKDGAALPADQLLALAIADFTQAGSFGLQTTAAVARAQRLAGNAAAATAAAASALSADADFVFLREFDSQSIENAPWAFLVNRALQEMQPLPRLDFLDPKFLDRESGIAVAKAEEMHLILAEAALASNDLSGAKAALADAIRLAMSRPTQSYNDDDPRLNADLSERPHTSSITIRSNASSPYRGGLVLTRPGVVTERTLSGTSLDADSVAALTTADQVWHAFHLARQEMFFLEGRRMSDLGIRLPMMLREIDSNPNIAEGDPGTVALIPAYLPPENDIDLYSPLGVYDADGNLVVAQVTMKVDMNRILADNRVNAFN